jgi:NCS1 family nucleobase:cation symporter-1
MPTSRDEEPGPDSSGRGQRLRVPRSSTDAESAPLLAGPSTDFQQARRRANDSLDISFGTISSDFPPGNQVSQVVHHCPDESYLFDIIMERVKSTRLAHLVDKLAVDSEPGLTNAQLMLNNHDLRPGMSNI